MSTRKTQSYYCHLACQSCLSKAVPKWKGGPKRVTNTRALQTAKCANGLANAVVFTSGLTTHTHFMHIHTRRVYMHEVIPHSPSLILSFSHSTGTRIFTQTLTLKKESSQKHPHRACPLSNSVTQGKQDTVGH